MDDLQTLKILSTDMYLEPAEDAGCPQPPAGPTDPIVSSAVLPNGRRIRMLKTLLTSACERNCFYCPFRAGRDFRRATFKPEALANTYMSLYRAGIAQGTFLSSGIVAGGVHTQDLLLDAADILRNKYGYTGYLHLKIMPGAQRAQVERAMQLADRVSINLEAPNDHRLSILAPRKQFLDELLTPLRWVEEIRRSQSPQAAWNHHWPSSVTQFVVGGAGESDLELLSTTEFLYRDLRLRRAYFSAFHPVMDTPLENAPATPVIRQHRLYQASFLLRDYGFKLNELPIDEHGNLSLVTDPKLAWARHHLAERPVELNEASRGQLMRIPGIGPQIADRILDARRDGRLSSLSQLGKMGANTHKLAPFILLDGHRPTFQPSFW